MRKAKPTFSGTLLGQAWTMHTESFLTTPWPSAIIHATLATVLLARMPIPAWCMVGRRDRIVNIGNPGPAWYALGQLLFGWRVSRDSGAGDFHTPGDQHHLGSNQEPGVARGHEATATALNPVQVQQAHSRGRRRIRGTRQKTEHEDKPVTSKRAPCHLRPPIQRDRSGPLPE